MLGKGREKEKRPWKKKVDVLKYTMRGKSKTEASQKSGPKKYNYDHFAKKKKGV